MQPSINVTVLDSEYWKPGQCIIKISECEFDYLFTGERKRLSDRNPECWIIVDNQNDVLVAEGDCRLFIYIDSEGIKNYSVRQFEDSQESSSTDTNIKSCPPHLFRCSQELRIIFCEKCGKNKPI